MTYVVKCFSVGVGHFRSQPGDEPCDWCVLVCGLWRYSGGYSRHGYSTAGHLFHPGGRSRVLAWEDETGVLGCTHILGAGRPVRCESMMSILTLLCDASTHLCHRSNVEVEELNHVIEKCISVLFQVGKLIIAQNCTWRSMLALLKLHCWCSLMTQ